VEDIEGIEMTKYLGHVRLVISDVEREMLASNKISKGISGRCLSLPALPEGLRGVGRAAETRRLLGDTLAPVAMSTGSQAASHEIGKA
jgi:hypothetical protein